MTTRRECFAKIECFDFARFRFELIAPCYGYRSQDPRETDTIIKRPSTFIIIYFLRYTGPLNGALFVEKVIVFFILMHLMKTKIL